MGRISEERGGNGLKKKREDERGEKGGERKREGEIREDKRVKADEKRRD